MDYSLSPYAPAYFVNFLLTTVIAVIALRRRHAPGALAFVGTMAAAAIWSFTQIFEGSAITAEASLFWTRVQYFGATTVSVAWFIFALRYSGIHILEGRRVWVLFVIPALTVVLAWTNSLHGLIWPAIHAMPGSIPLFVYEHGLAFWIHAVYAYILVITGSVILVRESIYAPRMHQYQTLALVAGAIAPLIANLIYVLGLTPVPGLDLTSFAFTLTGLLYLPALYNLRVLDITPVARGAIIDQMSDAIIVTDPQQRIVDVNAAVAELLGTETGDWIGRPLAKVLDALPELAALGGADQPTQSIITTRASPARTLEVRRTALNDLHHKPVGTLFLLRDVTQFRLAEQRSFDLALEHERVRLLSRFIRDASHEFRTPLAVVNTSLYLMERSSDADVQRQQRDKITAQVSQINGLLDDMLTMSRLDEREPLVLISVDLNELIRQVAEAERGESEHSPTIRLQLAPTLPAVLGDEAQLRRVIENLLRNALGFTSNEGMITLTSWEQGDLVLFSLTDTGIGMDAATQQHIFERFYRGDEAHSTLGAGLGLPIARSIVEAHGGVIEVTSALGKGSTFTVQLPAQPVMPAPAPERPSAPYRLADPLRPRSTPIIETP